MADRLAIWRGSGFAAVAHTLGGLRGIVRRTGDTSREHVQNGDAAMDNHQDEMETHEDREEGSLELSTAQGLDRIHASEWDALRGAEHSFTSWAFLEALERTGCVTAERGWWPLHLTARLDGRLVAAAPAYVKGDGMGDFSRDWAYHGALRQLGGNAYPKLVVGVPFSPVTSRRILVHPEFDETLAARLLMDLAREAARSADLGSVQVLYHHPDECDALEAAGLAQRSLVQYHWRNYDYDATQDWLHRLASRKRKQVRKEMRAPGSQGIEIRTWRGAETAELTDGDAAEAARVAFGLYRTTCDKYMWGGTYLNPAFFDELFTNEALQRSLELVTAQRPGSDAPREVVAGAINLASSTHLYGRYWGCHEEHRFLHFNVCLYHSIEQCIERGIQVFEGGAGGEHKVARGFEPSLVFHSLWFAQPHVHEALSGALARDAEQHRFGIEQWSERRGLDRPEARTFEDLLPQP